MALIKCPECNKEISSKAPTCPQCGAPVAVSQSPEAVTTIQETGKNLKIQQVLASLTMILGMTSCLMESNQLPPEEINFGVLIFLAGAFWLIWVQCSVWWRHG